MHGSIEQHQGTGRRALVAGLAIAAVLALGAGLAGATEIIPSVGLSNSVHGTDNTTNASAGLALRGEAGIFNPEVAVNYRTEERYDGALRTHMWPVTASLWVTPVPMLYAGAGVGWYFTSFNYDHDRFPLVANETRNDFGIHVGGGFKIPLSSATNVDVQGRYVMMRDQEAKLVPEKFNPDFWTLNAGLAFHF